MPSVSVTVTVPTSSSLNCVVLGSNFTSASPQCTGTGLSCYLFNSGNLHPAPPTAQLFHFSPPSVPDNLPCPCLWDPTTAAYFQQDAVSPSVYDTFYSFSATGCWGATPGNYSAIIVVGNGRNIIPLLSLPP